MQYTQTQMLHGEPTVNFHGFELPATRATSQLLRTARVNRPVALVMDLFPTDIPAGQGPQGLWLVYRAHRRCQFLSGLLWTPPDCNLTTEYGTVSRCRLAGSGYVALQHRPSLPEARCFTLPASPEDALAALGIQPSRQSNEVSQLSPDLVGEPCEECGGLGLGWPWDTAHVDSRR